MYEAGTRQKLLGKPDIREETKPHRVAFVRKVYGVLAGQLFVTVLISGLIYVWGQDKDWLKSHEWLLWLSVFMTIATVCAMSFAKDISRTFPANYAFLFVFTAFEAVFIGFLSAMFTWQTVFLVAVGTLVVVGALTGYAFATPTDLTGAEPFAVALVATGVTFGVCVGIVHGSGEGYEPLIVVYDALAIIALSFYLIIDTQLIMGKWGGHSLAFSIDDYAFAALNMYLDIVNMFILLLSLVGRREE